VTIGIRPSVVRYSDQPTVLGAISSRKAGEDVTVQFKQCGIYPLQFRDFMTTKTVEGGAWSVMGGLEITASGSFRAVWGDEVSRQVSLKMRPFVDLRRLPGGRGFTVRVAGTQSFWRRPVRIERFDFPTRKWVLVRKLLLTESEGPGDAGAPISETVSFRPGVAKGTTLRAVLPLAAARPCYAAGYSTLQRA
jgi:hypothetical protein